MSIPENIFKLYGGPIPATAVKEIPVATIFIFAAALIGGYVILMNRN